MTNPLAPKLATAGISPKAFWATFGSLAVGAALTVAAALLDYLTGHPETYAGLPPVVQVGITALLGTLVVAVAAYRARPGAVVVDVPPAHAQAD
jgi:hypothetical protein